MPDVGVRVVGEYVRRGLESVSLRFTKGRVLPPQVRALVGVTFIPLLAALFLALELVPFPY
jgi:hypothetical protein